MLASCLAAQWQCLCANAFLLNVSIAFIYTTPLERVIAVLKNPYRLSLWRRSAAHIKLQAILHRHSPERASSPKH